MNNALPCVYVDASRHVCLALSRTDTHVTFIATVEAGDSLQTVVKKLSPHEFNLLYTHPLLDYPVLRAVHHFLNPITRVSPCWRHTHSERSCC